VRADGVEVRQRGGLLVVAVEEDEVEGPVRGEDAGEHVGEAPHDDVDALGVAEVGEGALGAGREAGVAFERDEAARRPARPLVEGEGGGEVSRRHPEVRAQLQHAARVRLPHEAKQEPAPAGRGRRAAVDVGHPARLGLRLPGEGAAPRPRPIVLDAEHLGRGGEVAAETVDGRLRYGFFGREPQPRRPREVGRRRAEPPPLKADERGEEGGEEARRERHGRRRGESGMGGGDPPETTAAPR